MAMKARRVTVIRADDGISMPAGNLIDAAFAQIRQVGEGEGAARLFPNGLGSLELDFDADTRHISVKLVAAGEFATVSTPPAAADDMSILLDGDVQASFNANGHHVIALIAEQDLTQRLPNTWKKVQNVLTRGHRDLSAAATFADDIRNQQPQTKPFHFIDIPIERGGPTDPPLPHAPHVLTKIAESTAALKRGGTAQQMVDELSWLIHTFGDIHQPLHCAERISDLHPGGDRGGNSFLLKGSARNLHSLWDSSVSFTHESETTLVPSVMQEHSRKSLQADLRITDPEKWARSSYRLAKQFAYAPLRENPASPPKPSSAYLKQAEKIGRRQAALAGYRLADRLQEIFG